MSKYPTKPAAESTETVLAAAQPVETTEATMTEPAAVVQEPVVEQPQEATGAVVADTTVPVGTVSTPVQIKEAVAQKTFVAGAGLFSNDVQGLIDKIIASDNRPAIGVLETLTQYMKDMAPGKMVTDQVGARHQALLFRSLMAAINTVDKDFPLLFATILAIADEHSEGVFNARYLFRFMKDVNLNPNDQQAFMRILNMINTGAAVKGRSNAIKFVDFGRTMEFGVTEEGKRRILAFFNK